MKRNFQELVFSNNDGTNQIIGQGEDSGGGVAYTGQLARNFITLHKNEDLVADTHTVTVNGVVFTVKASGATGNEFNIGATYYATLTNLANAINASVSAGVAGLITASQSYTYGGDWHYLALYADVVGTAGNAYTLADNNSVIERYQSSFYGGEDAISQGPGSPLSETRSCHVIGRDSGIDDAAADSMILNSPNSYIGGNAISGTSIIGGSLNSTGGDRNSIIGSNDCHIYNTGYENLIANSIKCHLYGDQGMNSLIACERVHLVGTTYNDVHIGSYRVNNGSTYGWNWSGNCEASHIGEDSYGSVLFGTNQFVNSQYNFVIGNGAFVELNDYMFAQGAGDTIGRAQSQKTMFELETTSATAGGPKYTYVSTHMLNGGLSTSTAWGFKITCTATQYAGAAGTVGDTSIIEYRGGFKLVGETLAQVGTVSETKVAYDADAEPWNLQFIYNDSSDRFEMRAYGELNKSIKWCWSLELIEAGYA